MSMSGFFRAETMQFSKDGCNAMHHGVVCAEVTGPCDETDGAIEIAFGLPDSNRRIYVRFMKRELLRAIKEADRG